MSSLCFPCLSHYSVVERERPQGGRGVSRVGLLLHQPGAAAAGAAQICFDHTLDFWTNSLGGGSIACRQRPLCQAQLQQIYCGE